MSIISTLQQEMEQEAQTTRKMLSRIPDDKYDWQPHPKSMSIRQLATHVAELPVWVTLAVTTDGLDFATTPYEQVPIKNTDELMKYFEQSLENGKQGLAAADEQKLGDTWTLRAGPQVLSETSKAEMIRMTYSQIVHHRAQLGVYLRLLDIPIPGSYGPSADEQ